MGMFVCENGSDRMLFENASYLHFSFQFLCQVFSLSGYCTFSAPDRVAPQNLCENKCCFSVLLVGVIADYDDINRIFSSQHALCPFPFYFLFLILL